LSQCTDLLAHLKFVTFVNFSIIGSVLIVCGLYAVVWGKSKEIKKNNQLVPSQSSNEFDTVEIVVRHVVDDKRNHNSNNGHGNTSQEVKDNQDSLEGRSRST
jgi:hypothetical protein